MDKQEIFPDGTVIDKWFYDITILQCLRWHTGRKLPESWK